MRRLPGLRAMDLDLKALPSVVRGGYLRGPAAWPEQEAVHVSCGEDAA